MSAYTDHRRMQSHVKAVKAQVEGLRVLHELFAGKSGTADMTTALLALAAAAQQMEDVIDVARDAVDGESSRGSW